MFQELPFSLCSEQPSSDVDVVSDSGVESAALSERSYSGGASSLSTCIKGRRESSHSLNTEQQPAVSLRRTHSLPIVAMVTSCPPTAQTQQEAACIQLASGEDDDSERSVADSYDMNPDAGNICPVCYTNGGALSLDCCGVAICYECITEILLTSINGGIVMQIPCPNGFCSENLSEDTIHMVLQDKPDMLEKYDRFRIAQSDSDTRKPCPRCSKVLEHHLPRRKGGNLKEKDVKVTCSVCTMEWCFNCHAPWHAGQSCKEHRNGNKMFHKWIKGRSGPKGQTTANGHYCPGCHIPIQRTVGCNNMQCSKCNTNFCYQCGETFKNSLLFGSHYKTLTPNGCKGKYKGSTAERNFVIYSYLCIKCTVGLAYPALYIPAAGVVAVGVLAYLGYKHGREGYRKWKLNRRRFPRQR